MCESFLLFHQDPLTRQVTKGTLAPPPWAPSFRQILLGPPSLCMQGFSTKYVVVYAYISAHRKFGHNIVHLHGKPSEPEVNDRSSQLMY